MGGNDVSICPFENQLAAMTFSGRKLGADLQNNESIQWDVSPMPKNLKRATTLVVEGYGISRSTKKAAEAWQLVRYLTGPTAQTKLAMNGKTVPSRVSTDQSKVFLDFPGAPKKNNRAFIDSLFYARALPLTTQWPEIEKIIAEETDLLFSTGKVTARDSLIKAQSRIDKLTEYSSSDRLSMPSERKKLEKR
jgi:ABC-type glycerol-3-phosphate transport system substrate-binding protein